MVELQSVRRKTAMSILCWPPPNEAVRTRKISVTTGNLIKRSRLIRRSTTNHYCEELQRLKQEDGALIRQVLVISLQPRPIPQERRATSKETVEFWPVITFAHPPLDGQSKNKYQPEIFFPDFQTASNQRREEPQDAGYQLTLTDEKGDRSVAFCFKFVPKAGRLLSDCDAEKQTTSKVRSSVLVLVSNYPNESLYFNLAADFAHELQKEPGKAIPLADELLRLRVSDSQVGQQSLRRGRSLIGRPQPQYAAGHVSTLMQRIGVEDSVFAFLCLLAEKRVSRKCRAPSNRSFGFSLRSTFPHTVVPVIPDSLINLCYCPLPYISGILRSNLNAIRDVLCVGYYPSTTQDEEVVVLDVELGVVLPCFPPRTSRNTELRTKALLNWAEGMGAWSTSCSPPCGPVAAIKSAAKADEKIAKRIAQFYARTFGHYQAFLASGSTLLSARDRKRFASSHPSKRRPFFPRVTNGQPPTSAAMERLEQAIKKFAPPIHRTGKRKKARALVWRLFNH
ncbi:UDENN domain-containing protein [Aphelenchoides fujianensis]|nr:UDENN domain-containing protein [Aphelenchoides fujianensis]